MADHKKNHKKTLTVSLSVRIEPLTKLIRFEEQVITHSQLFLTSSLCIEWLEERIANPSRTSSFAPL